MGVETSGPELLHRFKGTLIGCAVGDALGAPFEGKPRSFFNAGTVGFEEFQRLPGFSPGQFTDDTQLTLAVAESLIQCGRFEPSDAAQRLGQLFSRGEIVSPGRATRAAFQRFLASGDWRTAAAPEGEAGNTPAKSAAPIGLWYHDRPDRLRDAAVALCRVTHQDVRAQAGAVAMARAVAYCLTERKLEPGSFLTAVAEPVSGICPPLAHSLSELESWIALPEDSALPLLIAAGAAPGSEIDPQQGVPGFVIPTVLSVFYFFLRYHDDFELCLQETIRAGGDVDTTASMVASLCGAFNGLDAIPENLASTVHNFKYILEVAERLFRRKTSN
jgi:ADP-ribosylglycohydrolase